MKNILFVHQSGELYGSDKTLLFLLEKLDRDRFNPIVIIPSSGPLVEELEKLGVSTFVIPIIKLSRSILSLKGLLSLPAQYKESLQAIDGILDGVQIDLVHSNTLAVLSGAFWAKKNTVPHLWHVHEMIIKPWVVKKVFGLLLRVYADWIVCNSNATKELILKDKNTLVNKTSVVWNGMNAPEATESKAVELFRQDIGLSHDMVLFTLMGRINRWKGQKIFVEAAELLVKKYPNKCKFLVIGSPPPGQDIYLEELRAKIISSPAEKSIIIKPFTSDIWTVWAATDVAVVPSTEPEPFGLVALEAMATSKPVIAANHGGLAEIVIHGETGLLCEPCNATSLAKAMGELANSPSSRGLLGKSGRLRFEDKFSLQRYVSQITAVYESMIDI